MIMDVGCNPWTHKSLSPDGCLANTEGACSSPAVHIQSPGPHPQWLHQALGLHLGYIGVYIGIMEKTMETTIALGLYWGIYRDNGKENGNYYSVGVILGYI